jgi:hypothetical protein
VAGGPYEGLPTPNLPRSVFLNRESFPLVWSSLSIAEYTAVDLPPRLIAGKSMGALAKSAPNSLLPTRRRFLSTTENRGDSFVATRFARSWADSESQTRNNAWRWREKSVIRLPIHAVPLSGSLIRFQDGENGHFLACLFQRL